MKLQINSRLFKRSSCLRWEGWATTSFHLPPLPFPSLILTHVVRLYGAYHVPGTIPNA